MRLPPLPREGVRYLENARAILSRIPFEGEVYVDRKPVREAMGTAYLAVLEAINEALLRRGLTRRELPRSVDAYRLALQKHFGARNGKLLREFESLYDLLHLSGYYRVTIYRRKAVKNALDEAQHFVDLMAR